VPCAWHIRKHIKAIIAKALRDVICFMHYPSLPAKARVEALADVHIVMSMVSQAEYEAASHALAIKWRLTKATKPLLRRVINRYL